MPSSTHGFFLSLEESPTKETAVAQAFGAYLQDFSANVSFGSQIYCHNEEASSQGRLRLSLSPSLSPFLSSSAEYQYDTFLYFWFLFESFLFPSLTFPRNHRCFSSKLATLITCKPLFCSFFSFPPFFLQYIVLCT